ncbi:hypothetical protein PoB_005893000 [Plakobranchus ocellatus]|uniref:Uncharacterized protein n=1 Tax=Plakobranchus ocellatus TaxID=259542 RepID=A0AAV4CHS6_9GAST|nr:hypothetical protein PoB_005893000 [Plakobranchus ocellatus]
MHAINKEAWPTKHPLLRPVVEKPGIVDSSPYCITIITRYLNEKLILNVTPSRPSVLVELGWNPLQSNPSYSGGKANRVTTLPPNVYHHKANEIDCSN